MKTLLLFLSVFLSTSLYGQLTYVPDDNFEQWLITYGYDDVLDDSVDTDNISVVFSLDLGFSSNAGTIYDLTGIQGFTSLQSLICDNNQLTSLDLSQNSALETVVCVNNQLTSLDISGGALQLLSCGDNQLTSLDISQNPDLTWLSCSNNPITSLEVSQNTTLQTLYCTNLQLTSIDVSQNTDLRQLRCYENQLTSLDVSHNSALYILQCAHNPLTSLDLSQNPALEYLYCAENQLTSLDLSNHSALYALNCESNQLTCLHVANENNTNFIEFNTTNNPNLSCIEVDDADWSAVNWTSIDPQTSFSENCNDPSNCFSSLNELTSSKTLIQILDMMGRETTFKPNRPLIYVYDDGSTEKVYREEY